MRSLPPDIVSYLATNSGVKTRQLLWITATNRNTGSPESIGLWTGEDTQVFTIDGEARTYYGSGQFINFGNVTLASNLNIQKLTVTLTPISPEMEQVFRGYDAKFASVECHNAFYNTETNNLVAPPVVFYKGWIDKLVITMPPVGGSGEARMDIVGNSRILTNRLAIKRSNDSQQLRLNGDAFFRDVNISGQVQTPWGSKSVSGSGAGGLKGFIATRIAPTLSRMRSGQ